MIFILFTFKNNLILILLDIEAYCITDEIYSLDDPNIALFYLQMP